MKGKMKMLNQAILEKYFPRQSTREIASLIYERVDLPEPYDLFSVGAYLDEEADMLTCDPEIMWEILRSYASPFEPDANFALESFKTDLMHAYTDGVMEDFLND